MNETTVTTVKAAIAAAVATMTALWGLVRVAGDRLGAADAGGLADRQRGGAKEGRWSSAKMREGAWHKGGMILVVCIALVADWLIGEHPGAYPGGVLPFDYSVCWRRW